GDQRPPAHLLPDHRERGRAAPREAHGMGARDNGRRALLRVRSELTMLNTIRTYIDGLFAELPDSPDVNRAHADLVRMSEDKYHELRDEGLTDNEATGRVITEFGNLDDLADDLGIRTQLDRAAT